MAARRSLRSSAAWVMLICLAPLLVTSDARIVNSGHSRGPAGPGGGLGGSRAHHGRVLEELGASTYRTSSEQAFRIMVAAGLDYCTDAAAEGALGEDQLDGLLEKLRRSDSTAGVRLVEGISRNGGAGGGDRIILEISLTKVRWEQVTGPAGTAL